MNIDELKQYINSLDNNSVRKIASSIDNSRLRNLLYRKDINGYVNELIKHSLDGDTSILKYPFANDLIINNDEDTLLHNIANNIKDVPDSILNNQNIISKNNLGLAPLHILAKKTKKEIFNLSKYITTLTDNEKNTPLHYFLQNMQDISKYQKVLDISAVNRIKNDNGFTPLALFVVNKYYLQNGIDYETFKILVKHNDINYGRYGDYKISISHILFSKTYDRPKLIYNYVLQNIFSDPEIASHDIDGNLPTHYFAAALVKDTNINDNTIELFSSTRLKHNNDKGFSAFDILKNPNLIDDSTSLYNVVFENKLGI